MQVPLPALLDNTWSILNPTKIKENTYMYNLMTSNDILMTISYIIEMSSCILNRDNESELSCYCFIYMYILYLLCLENNILKDNFTSLEIQRILLHKAILLHLIPQRSVSSS